MASVALFVLLAVIILIVCAPNFHCFDNGAHGLSKLGQSVFHPRRDFGIDGAGDDAIGLHGAQADIPTDRYAVMQLLLGYPREGDKHPTPKPRKERRIIRIGEGKG